MSNDLNEALIVEETIKEKRIVKPWEYWVDLLIVVITSVGLFALLGHFELEHDLLFLFSVAIALFALKYNILKSLLPSILIIGLGVLVHFNEWQHALLFLPFGLAAGLIHAYVIEHKGINMKSAVWTVIIAEIVLNISLTAILFIIKDPVFSGHSSTLSQITAQILGNGEGINYFLDAGEIALLAMTGVLEALFTHILVHFFAARVFKFESGHTFTGMGIDFPNYVTVAYLVTISYVVYSFFIPDISGFLLSLQHFSINIVLGAYIFYVFTGCGVIAQLIYYKFNRRLTAVVVLIGFLLSPIVWLIGIVDSLFNIRKRIPVSLSYSLD